MKPIWVGGVLATLLAGACAVSMPTTEPAAASLCRSDLAREGDPANAAAVAMIEAKMRERRIPGLQAAVVKQGRIVMLQSCGIANVEFQLPVRRDTRFPLASATKPFTGVAVMQLVSDGKLMLDAPLADYLDDMPGAWRAVTVRQALMHVSGLPDMIDPSIGKLIDPRGEAPSWERVKTLPMVFAPGQGYRYNQTNYFLLGRIIDKLSGKPFAEMIRERQFVPADMPTATFADMRDVTPGRASVYRFAEPAPDRPASAAELKALIIEYPPAMRTAAGLMLPAQEAATWIIALHENRLLTADARREMWTAGRMPDGKPTAWALGWPAYPRDQHPAVAGIGGGSAAFYVYPDDGDLAVVILTNLSGGQPELFIEEVAKLYGGTPASGAK